MKYIISKRETQNNITPLLWGGLALWLTAIIISSILAIFGIDYVEQDELNGLFNHLGSISPLLLFMVVCIIGPILEEFAFRYWTVGNMLARIISFILATVFVYIESGNNIFISLGVAALLFVLMFLIKKNEIALIISTSVIFSLLHINGFSSVSVGVVLGLIQLFAEAVIMCCLALKYHFAIAIVIHIVGNIIAIAPANEDGKTYTDIRYNHNITNITREGKNTMACKPMNGKRGDLINLSDSIATVVSFQGSMSEFIDMLYDIDTGHTMTILYRMNEKTEKTMPTEYSFVLKLCDTGAIDYNNILCTTMKFAAFLKQDTLYESAYLLNIKNSGIFSSRQTDCEFPITINDLATKIKFIFDKPIIIADNIDKNQIVCLGTLSINELYNLKNIELLKEELNNTFGIDLIETDIKLPVIEFSEYDLK